MAERVLCPGDPGRALRLATALTDKPLMLNHHRGLWGYTGTADDGLPLTVQGTGLGGPSTAAVVADLARLGARRVVRVGTCVGDLPPGTVVTADPVHALDGTSTALGPAGPTLAGPEPRVALASTDVPAGPVPAGVRARDLTSAAFLAAAAAHGLQAAVLCVVVQDAAGATLAEEELHAAELGLGRAALTLLASA